MIYKANDKYSGVLTAGYTVGQSTLYVSAVPDNVPTIVVAAKGTDNETIFEVTDKTTNSLTGVSRLRGANVDLDAQTPLTCLNNEEFINQYAGAASSPETLANLLYGVDGGSTDAYAITLDPAPSAYVPGMLITFKANTANTGAATLNVNGLGAKSIKMRGADPATGEITAGQIVTVVYDGTNFQLVSRAPLIAGDWTPAGETWTYKSATEVYAAGNVTAIYQKGDKFRYKQGGGWKYGSLIGVSAYDSGNNRTTLTITGGTDYTVASAAITDNQYSKAENPQGFPDWFNYTTTTSCSGSMTYTDVFVRLAKFRISGQSCQVIVSMNGTTGGTTSSTIYASTPVTINVENLYLVTGAGVEGGVVGGVMFNQSTTLFGFRKYDNSNWTLAANMRIQGQMTYPI